MANEIQVSFAHGQTLYVLVRNSVGQIWNGAAFENYLTAHYANYPISVVEQGTASHFYAGNFPAAAAGVYSLEGRQQLAGSPAETDPTIGMEDFQWNGVAEFPLSDLTVSGSVGTGNIKIFRGQMIQNFPFKLVSSTDHVTPLTSGIVSGQIARDGGAFGALQSGRFTEMGLGWYALQALTSGDLLANTAALVFTANGISGGQSDPRDFGLVLQRSSGQA